MLLSLFRKLLNELKPDGQPVKFVVGNTCFVSLIYLKSLNTGTKKKTVICIDEREGTAYFSASWVNQRRV